MVGTGEIARRDGVAHVDRKAFRAAQVADGRDPGDQRPARVLRARKRPLRRRREDEHARRLGLPAHLEMHVAIDESGCDARRFHDARVRRQRHVRGADCGDAFALQEQHAVAFGFSELVVQRSETDRECGRRV